MLGTNHFPPAPRPSRPNDLYQHPSGALLSVCGARKENEYGKERRRNGLFLHGVACVSVGMCFHARRFGAWCTEQEERATTMRFIDPCADGTLFYPFFPPHVVSWLRSFFTCPRTRRTECCEYCFLCGINANPLSQAHAFSAGVRNTPTNAPLRIRLALSSLSSPSSPLLPLPSPSLVRSRGFDTFRLYEQLPPEVPPPLLLALTSPRRPLISFKIPSSIKMSYVLQVCKKKKKEKKRSRGIQAAHAAKRRQTAGGLVICASTSSGAAISRSRPFAVEAAGVTAWVERFSSPARAALCACLAIV